MLHRFVSIIQSINLVIQWELWCKVIKCKFSALLTPETGTLKPLLSLSLLPSTTSSSIFKSILRLVFPFTLWLMVVTHIETNMYLEQAKSVHWQKKYPSAIITDCCAWKDYRRHCSINDMDTSKSSDSTSSAPEVKLNKRKTKLLAETGGPLRLHISAHRQESAKRVDVFFHSVLIKYQIKDIHSVESYWLN